MVQFECIVIRCVFSMYPTAFRRNTMRLFFLCLIFAALPISLQAQDQAKKIDALLKTRASAIAKIDRDFRIEFAKIRNDAVKDLEQKVTDAMKALDLEKSNKLNQELEKWRRLAPTIRRRSLFVRVLEDESSGTAFFVRGSGDIWIEYNSPDEIYTHTVRQVTPKYIEIEHERGIVHRLYDSKIVFKDRSTGNRFVPKPIGFEGYWLQGVEVDIPEMD